MNGEPDIIVVRGREKSIFTGKTKSGQQLLYNHFKLEVRATSITVETEHVDELVDDLNSLDNRIIIRVL